MGRFTRFVKAKASSQPAMELVGKVVRKEIVGVGFCSGRVQSYGPSGHYKIVYENGVTETSKLAEFAALVMGEDKSEETPVQLNHRKRNRKQPRAQIKRYKKKLPNELNVTRNVDLNEEGI
ncbi:hypothetical protein Bca4012_025786 [Brassica carinata]